MTMGSRVGSCLPLASRVPLGSCLPLGTWALVRRRIIFYFPAQVRRRAEGCHLPLAASACPACVLSGCPALAQGGHRPPVPRRPLSGHRPSAGCPPAAGKHAADACESVPRARPAWTPPPDEA